MISNNLHEENQPKLSSAKLSRLNASMHQEALQADNKCQAVHSLKEKDSFLDAAKDVLQVESMAIMQMARELSQEFERAIEIILHQRGRTIVSGMGKSGHIGRKIAATLASTGTPAQFVHPGEASHGDLGMVTRDDVCILLSNSGETLELADIIAHTRRFCIPLISISRDRESTLARQSDVTLQLPNAPEACSIGMAPTTSTTCALALGDALAVTLMKLRGFKKEGFLTLHPGGRLGARLLNVGTIMHTGEKLPIVSEQSHMGEALVEMTRKGFGVAAVVQEGHLTGVITDGDLRRNLKNLMEMSAGQVATRSPLTIRAEALASEALGVMNENKISALFIVSDEGAPIGIIHIHDCLRAGIV